MKQKFYLLWFVPILLSCNLSGHRNEAEDSLHYYPPTPVVIDKKDFRKYYRELNAFFDTSLLNSGFNGGILIAKNGSVIYEKYKGFADLRKKDTLTEFTSMHIASVSKTFTAAAILHMVGKGQLSLNDTITRFFPSLPYPGITLKMLLSHRSGLPNYLYFMPKADWEKNTYVLNQDVLNYLVAKKPDKMFFPGTRFSYCNTNYIILALLIEKISGKSYPEYLKQEFFDPLQMNHTYVFTLKDTLTATASFTGNGAFWDFDFLDGTYGDKNIYTTPRDLLKWDQALYTTGLISKALLDSAFKGYSFEKPSVHNYGLGWRLQLLPNGKKVIYHFGKWHGFNAAFARLTDENATIIILGNKFTRTIYNAAHLCYDIFGDYNQRGLNEEEDTDSILTEKKTNIHFLKKPKTKKNGKAGTKAKH